jgi:PncC family amidohydrolase
VDRIQTIETLARTLRAKSWQVACAESCTGGGIAAALTDLAGSSEWFDRGFVTYSNRAKHAMLGVAEETLQAYGAVSRETVIEMAKGALGRSEAQLTVAVSGIAGPGMDDNRKKALAAALSQIEKQFGKGSVMRMGDAGAMPNIEAVSTGSLGLDVALGIGGGCPRGRGRRDLRAGVLRQDDADAARRRRGAEAGGTAPSSTPSMRSTRPTPRSSASTWTSCWCRSRTPASRRSRSPTCWCAPVRSTWSSSTRSRR